MRENTRWGIEEWKEAGAVIGKNVVSINSFIDRAFPWLVEVGDNTVLTGTTILAHDASTHPALGYSKVGFTRIGKDCFIGHGSIILAGVKVGDRCIVGAGSVISKDVPENSVVVGFGRILPYTRDEYLEMHRMRIEDSDVVINKVVTDRDEQEKLRKQIEANGGYAV